MFDPARGTRGEVFKVLRERPLWGWGGELERVMGVEFGWVFRFSQHGFKPWDTCSLMSTIGIAPEERFLFP
jgi:hypothetical protein